MQSYDDFKNALGQRESGNRYNISNSSGCLGRYQFCWGSGRLQELGYTGTQQQFLNSPDTQEHYFDLHVQDHAQHLQQYLNQAQNALGNGVTLSGLIAGAHLGGRGGVTDLVNDGIDHADSNGTHISDYISEFSGYDIPGYTESGNSNGSNDPISILPGLEAHGATASEDTGSSTGTYLVLGTLVAIAAVAIYNNN